MRELERFSEPVTVFYSFSVIADDVLADRYVSDMD